jgi:hypothetical protein
MRWLWLALIAGVVIMGGSAVKVSRGIRNNNPGNIRHGADKWQGMASEQPDSQFIKFVSAQYGIRAMARILASYRRRGLVTVRQIINTWAPPVGQDAQGNRYTQNSDAYVAHVARVLQVEPDQAITWTAGGLADLVTVIIQHENGAQPYDRAVIVEGVSLAGVV